MLIDIHTHKDILEEDIFSIKNISINQNIDINYKYSLGIHPWEKDFNEYNFDIVKKLALRENILMVGETGIDKLKGEFLLQKEYFIKHVNLSEEIKKPLIIHCVKAFEDIIKIKKTINPKQKWIIHGFSKGKDLAKQLVDNGFYLSFGESILNNNKTINAFIDTPKDRIFLETDNKNILIEDVYFQVLKIIKIKLKELELLIENNLKSIME